MLQGVGVDTTGQDLARVWYFGIPSARQAGDRIEEDHHFVAIFHHAFGLLDHHFRDLNMAARRFIKRTADDFAIRTLDLPFHFRHFFRPLVDQQHDHIGFRMIVQDGLGQLLQQDRLTRTRRRHDQGSLSHADRGHQVDNTRAELLGLRRQSEATFGVERCQIVEEYLLCEDVRILTADRFDAEQGEVAFVFFRGANLARDRGTRPQPEPSNLAGRDVDIVGAGEVVIVGTAQEAETIGQDFQRPFAEHQAVHLGPLFQDLEDQVLLLQTGVIGQLLDTSLSEQLRHRHALQFGDVNFALLDFFIALVGGSVAEVFIFVGVILDIPLRILLGRLQLRIDRLLGIERRAKSVLFIVAVSFGGGPRLCRIGTPGPCATQLIAKWRAVAGTDWGK